MTFAIFVWGCICNVAGGLMLLFGTSLGSAIAGCAYLIAGAVLMGAALICREIGGGR